METNKELIDSPPTNTQAIVSLVFGILTAFSFCAGAIPIPFTGFVCFPLSFLSAILALISGAVALNQTRKRNESGSPMAWIGIVAGGFVFICLICMLVALASLFVFAPGYISPAPFFDNHQL